MEMVAMGFLLGAFFWVSGYQAQRRATRLEAYRHQYPSLYAEHLKRNKEWLVPAWRVLALICGQPVGPRHVWVPYAFDQITGWLVFLWMSIGSFFAPMTGMQVSLWALVFLAILPLERLATFYYEIKCKRSQPGGK